MALPNKKTPFDSNISSKKLNTDLNFTFDRGWSPILAPVLQSHKVVLKIQDWVGGEGDKPYDTTVYTYYLGPIGLVTDINDAVNIAEDFITSDWLSHIIEKTSVTFTLENVSNDINLKVDYTDLEGTAGTYTVLILNDTEISDIDITNPVIYGATRTAIAKAIKTLREWIIIDNYLSTPWSQTQALSQNATMNAIDVAKAKFDVPIVDLTTELIQETEQLDGLTSTNPYYMLVNEDNRIGGRHTPNCPIVCINQCCDLNDDGGYEERGNRTNIEGCRCTAGTDEVLAVCRITVTGLGATGDRYDYDLNGIPYTWYVVQPGDTIPDVVAGLIANLPNECTTGRDCNLGNVTSTSFDLTAIAGSGSTPNSWTKTVSTSGTASGTFVQIVNGVDYLATTYRGVKHHIIAYDGTNWYDFGNSLSFGNNSENSTCECTFIHMTDTPDSYATYAGYIPTVNSAEDALEWIDHTFLTLHDTPDTYTGSDNYRVKVDGTSLEFVDDSILQLNDTPGTYTAQAGKFLTVNAGATAMEFRDVVVAAENGLHLSADSRTVLLGGELIEDTEITGDNFKFEVDIDDIINDRNTILTINDGANIILKTTDTISSGHTQLRLDSTYTSLSVNNGTNTSGFILEATQPLEISDGIFSKGLIYSADYSTNFTNRSLIDKEYTDSHINGKSTSTLDALNSNTGPGAIEDGFSLKWDNTLSEYTLSESINSLTASNGLTLTGFDVELGGILTQDTSVFGIYEFDININNSGDYGKLTVNENGASLQGYNTLTNNSTLINSNKNEIEIRFFKDGSDESKIKLTLSQMLILDNINSKGLEYESDYSHNYTNRSLVDKEYVDGKVDEMTSIDVPHTGLVFNNCTLNENYNKHVIKIGNIVIESGIISVVVDSAATAVITFSPYYPIDDSEGNQSVKGILTANSTNHYVGVPKLYTSAGKIDLACYIAVAGTYEYHYNITYKVSQ